ncbi:MAG: glycosyltransferase [Bacteroidota bacterium]
MPQKRISISVINDLAGDQRIHRIASTLQASGYQVCVIGRKLPDSLPLPGRSYETKRMRLIFKKGKLFYLEYNFRLFLLLLFSRVDILNSNDLDTLLANALVANLRRKALVYDSHEIYTEVPELIHRRATRAVWLALERLLFPRLQHVYTVNGSLAKIYQAKYQVPVKVVRNLPFARSFPSNASPRKILLYQGAVNLGRGIDLMIQAMQYMPQVELWIVGKGDVLEEMKRLAEELSLGERIKFWGFVALEHLPEITRQARIGLSLEEDRGANYRYASPNKVYDYIQSGLPVLVSDLPEMRALVEQYQVGAILPSAQRKPMALANLLLEMLNDQVAFDQWRQNCQNAAKELNWETEKEKLLAIYQGL